MPNPPLGSIALCTFLILFGILGLTGAAVPFLLPIVAIIAGVLILIGR